MAYNVTLMTARTSNGTDGAQGWSGGRAIVSAWGTWNGATVQISFTPDGTTFIDTSGATFTADGTAEVVFPAGQLKATISSAGGSTSLSAKIQRIGTMDR